jgi:hypothetical protein
MSIDELIPYWNGFFKEKIIFNYIRCSKCSLIFAPNFFTSSHLERLYAQMPANMSEVPEDALKNTQLGYVKTLALHITDRDAGYIEVGPDTGLFVEQHKKNTSHNHHWLLEPNQVVTEQLSKVMAGENFLIIKDMFGFEHIPNNCASVAIMVQVIDHLLDPLETLKALRVKMKTNGRLLLVNHDESSLLRKLFGWRWPAFCLQHPQLFSPKSMKRLLAEAGFEVVVQKKTTNYFKVSFLLKHLLWACGFKPTSVPDFGQLIIGLRLGNMLTIAQPACLLNEVEGR